MEDAKLCMRIFETLFMAFLFLLFILKWVKKGRGRYYFLLVLIIIFSGVAGAFQENSILEMIGNSGMMAGITLVSVRLAHFGGKKREKLLFTGVIILVILIYFGSTFSSIAAPEKGDAVRRAALLAALAMGQLGGWLESRLFEKKESPPSDT